MGIHGDVAKSYCTIENLFNIVHQCGYMRKNFSKLKHVRTYLRSKMSQLRLSSLAMLSMEREVSNRLEFDEVIKDFDIKKARKINL